MLWRLVVDAPIFLRPLKVGQSPVQFVSPLGRHDQRHRLPPGAPADAGPSAVRARLALGGWVTGLCIRLSVGWTAPTNPRSGRWTSLVRRPQRYCASLTAAPQHDGAYAAANGQRARKGNKPGVPLFTEEGGAREQQQANDDESHVLTSAGAGSFAHYPVAVPVVHERVGGVIAADGIDPMGAGLPAGDPSVPVFVVQPERVGARSASHGRDRRRRWG